MSEGLDQQKMAFEVKNMGNKKHLEFNMCHEIVVTFSPQKVSFFSARKMMAFGSLGSELQTLPTNLLCDAETNERTKDSPQQQKKSGCIFARIYKTIQDSRFTILRVCLKDRSSYLVRG